MSERSKSSQFQLDVHNVLGQLQQALNPRIIYKAGCVPVICPDEYAKEVVSGVARKRGDCIGMDYLPYNGDGGYVIKALQGVSQAILPIYTIAFQVKTYPQKAFPCANKEYYYYCWEVYNTAMAMYKMELDEPVAA